MATNIVQIGTTAAGLYLLGVCSAQAIIIRHDVADAQYVVNDADYPALVDLIAPGDCIGTLVHESYLLSVAHCAVDLSVGDPLEISGVSHSVAEVVLHPSWRDLSEYDIALVRLEQPVTGVEPIPIYRGSDEDGSTIALVGRGVTATGLVGEAGGDTDGQLRRATNIVTGVDDHFLEVRFDQGAEPEVTDLEGVGAAGDSGCPALLEVDGTRYIAGLNSEGDSDDGIGIGQYGAWDYQTRVSRYVEWFDGVIDEAPGGTGGSDGDSDGSEGSPGEASESAGTTEDAADAGNTSGEADDSSGALPEPSGGLPPGGGGDSGCAGCSVDNSRSAWWLLVVLLLARRGGKHSGHRGRATPRRHGSSNTRKTQ